MTRQLDYIGSLYWHVHDGVADGPVKLEDGDKVKVGCYHGSYVDLLKRVPDQYPTVQNADVKSLHKYLPDVTPFDTRRALRDGSVMLRPGDVISQSTPYSDYYHVVTVNYSGAMLVPVFIARTSTHTVVTDDKVTTESKRVSSKGSLYYKINISNQIHASLVVGWAPPPQLDIKRVDSFSAPIPMRPVSVSVYVPSKPATPGVEKLVVHDDDVKDDIKRGALALATMVG